MNDVLLPNSFGVKEEIKSWMISEYWILTEQPTQCISDT